MATVEQVAEVVASGASVEEKRAALEELRRAALEQVAAVDAAEADLRRGVS